MNYSPFLAIILVSAVITGCSLNSTDKKFEVIDASSSGIEFANSIVANDTFNVIDFYYIYNGGGVAIGDFNQDGLQDVYFTGNEVPNALYLNKGKYGMDSSRWRTENG